MVAATQMSLHFIERLLRWGCQGGWSRWGPSNHHLDPASCGPFPPLLQIKNLWPGPPNGSAPLTRKIGVGTDLLLPGAHAGAWVIALPNLSLLWRVVDVGMIVLSILAPFPNITAAHQQHGPSGRGCGHLLREKPCPTITMFPHPNHPQDTLTRGGGEMVASGARLDHQMTESLPFQAALALATIPPAMAESPLHSPKGSQGHLLSEMVTGHSGSIPLEMVGSVSSGPSARDPPATRAPT